MRPSSVSKLFFVTSLAAASSTAGTDVSRRFSLSDGDEFHRHCDNESGEGGGARCARAPALGLIQRDQQASRRMILNQNPAHDLHSENATKALVLEQQGDPPVPDPHAKDAAGKSGVGENDAEDLDAFLSALGSNVFVILFVFFVFGYLKERYKLTFQSSVLDKTAPCDVPEGRCGWISAAWNATSNSPEAQDALAEAVGLDQAMFLEFTKLGQKIMLWIGIPFICVLGPVHCIFGGTAAGEDGMSYFSAGNVEYGSWIYTMHAFIVWYVVLVVQANIYWAQAKFIPRRFKWLRELNVQRANTVLVECIPPELQNDEKLLQFFKKLFPSRPILSAYIVKKTSYLQKLVSRREAALRELHKAEQTQGQQQPRSWSSRLGFGSSEDPVERYRKQVADYTQEVNEERTKLKTDAKEVGGSANSGSAFVTFQERADAEIAKSLRYHVDSDVLVVSTPPPLQSILWEDLEQSDVYSAGFTILGYGLIFGLYMAYLPLVVGISNLAEAVDMGPMQAFWEGMAPTIGLQFMVAFLPTFLLLIFRFCFTLKDDTFAQHTLQNWYFVFSVVFVILVTSIGSNVGEFTKKALTDIPGLMEVFGRTMPQATHFYMNYIVLQWAAHATNCLRMVQLFKYWSFKQFWSEEDAAKMAEPEDQDYYGIGSRSARETVNLCIGVIFCTLCPPITPLVFFNFVMCRTVYGYLIPFTETKKPDLGGVFWVSQLEHLFTGNVLYVLLMVGVLGERAPDEWAAVIAALSLVYVGYSYVRFTHAFTWKDLPYTQVSDEDTFKKPILSSEGAYIQPELTDDPK